MPLDVAHRVRGSVSRRDVRVQRDHRPLLADRPRVHVMHVDHVRQRRAQMSSLTARASNPAASPRAGCAALRDDVPGRAQDDHGDDHRQQRVDRHPARRQGSRSTRSPRRPSRADRRSRAAPPRGCSGCGGRRCAGSGTRPTFTARPATAIHSISPPSDLDGLRRAAARPRARCQAAIAKSAMPFTNATSTENRSKP